LVRSRCSMNAWMALANRFLDWLPHYLRHQSPPCHRFCPVRDRLTYRRSIIDCWRSLSGLARRIPINGASMNGLKHWQEPSSIDISSMMARFILQLPTFAKIIEPFKACWTKQSNQTRSINHWRRCLLFRCFYCFPIRTIKRPQLISPSIGGISQVLLISISMSWMIGLHQDRERNWRSLAWIHRLVHRSIGPRSRSCVCCQSERPEHHWSSTSTLSTSTSQVLEPLRKLGIIL